MFLQIIYICTITSRFGKKNIKNTHVLFNIFSVFQSTHSGPCRIEVKITVLRGVKTLCSLTIAERCVGSGSRYVKSGYASEDPNPYKKSYGSETLLTVLYLCMIAAGYKCTLHQKGRIINVHSTKRVDSYAAGPSRQNVAGPGNSRACALCLTIYLNVLIQYRSICMYSSYVHWLKSSVVALKLFFFLVMKLISDLTPYLDISCFQRHISFLSSPLFFLNEVALHSRLLKNIPNYIVII